MDRRTSTLALWLLLLGLLGAATARAERAPKEQEARVHVDAATKLYRLQNFAGALREFEAANELAPRPAYLIQIAKCHHALGDLEHARDFYQRYLDSKPVPPPSQRTAVRRVLKQIEQQLAEFEPAAPPVAAKPPEPPPVKVAPAPPPPIETEIPASLLRAAHPAASPRAHKRTWIWATLGVAAALAAGAGVGLGLGLSHTPAEPSTYLGVMTITFQ